MSLSIVSSIEDVLAFCALTDDAQDRHVRDMMDACGVSECQVWIAILSRVEAGAVVLLSSIEADEGRQLVRELNCYVRDFRKFIARQSKWYGKRIGYWPGVSRQDSDYRFGNALMRRLAGMTRDTCRLHGTPSITCRIEPDQG